MNVMNRLLSAVFVGLALCCTSVAATPGAALWNDVAERDIPRNERARDIVPNRYRTLRLNRGALMSILAKAPAEQALRVRESKTTIDLPTPGGGYDTFRIVDSPIMEPALAAKFPMIRTFLGESVSDRSTTVRFDITPKGFHAQILSPEGTLYIDPFQRDDQDHYISYRKRDHDHGKQLACGVTGSDSGTAGELDHVLKSMAKLSSGTTLRTYRLAMAATGEYTSFHGGTVAEGLAAIVTTMNRVNAIYEREVSVRMVLVANNDLIVYTNSGTDPYANTSNDLNANQSNIDGVIGSGNYDIGHLVGTGGGGVAQLGSVCGSGKARGLTGSPSPVGDGFDVDYVAHEVGHQFAGNHTFNGSGGSCAGGNRSSTTAYEPGSGISIQAYAGICGGDDLQPNSEDHFHRVSLNEILNFTTTGAGANCDAPTATGNAVPTVTAPGNFTIPGRTPFTLTASGTDGDGDTLSYHWEQFDLATAANAEGVLSGTVTSGPLFRSFAPTSSPSRTFPSWRYILGNANVPPATAPMPGTTTPAYMTGEVLPNANRTLNFRVTVRDNRAGGGGTNEATSQVTIANAAGPFALTAPNTAVTWATGSTQTVTWNVAGTTAAPINTANVRIRLSTDGGVSFPIELLANTPNDGTQLVTLPAGLASTQARVMVEAVGNIYFDVSDVNFTITDAGKSPPAITVTGALTTSQGSPTATATVATISDAQDLAANLLVAVEGAPPELTVSASNSNGSVSLTAAASCLLVAPTAGTKIYPVVLRVTDSDGDVSTASVNVAVGANPAPAVGSYGTLSITQNATRQHAPASPPSDGNENLLASPMSISPLTLPGGGTLAIAADGTVTATTTASTPFGTYPVTVRVQDACGATEPRQFNVVVGAPNITLAVTGSEVLTGNAIVEPNECNQVRVQVTNNGNTTATGVNATLTTSTPNVTITQANSAYPDIGPGQTQSNSTAFEVSTTNGATCFSNINLSLSVSYSGAAGSPLVAPVVVPIGRAAAVNYTFTSSGGATLPNDGTLLTGSQLDDALVNLTIPAGFNFSVYGTTYTGGTTLRASANGNLQFRATQGSSDPANTAIPTAGTGNGQAVFPPTAPTMFLLWDDWQMDPASGNVPATAGIYTKLEGTAPNRRWIIEWRGRVKGDGATTTINNRAAIIFYENSNDFDYVYLQSGVGAATNGAGATIGIQAASSGTTFTQFGLNSINVAPGTRLSATQLPAVCTAGSGVCGLAAGVTISESGGATNVVEGGATDSYTVVLNAAPSADVTITMTPDTQVGVSPTSLVFTTATWNIPQTVTVTAVNDAVAEGTHAGTITHAASGGGYTGVSVANVTANIIDNDIAGVTIVESGGSTHLVEGGATDTYTVVLNTQPTASVNITPTGNAQVTASPATLTFTTANWNVAQTVTATAVNDAVAEGAHTGTITHAASGGGYTGLGIASVTVNITDNDFTLTYAAGAGGTISGPTPQTVSSGGSGAAVTAVPNAGYSFVNWSDGSTANPRTDTNVTTNLSVTANFAINTYTLTYAAGAGGTISGTSPQTVNHGANGSAVTAVPNAGYSFVNWSDGSTANPRTDTNVTANLSVTANFAIKTYTLTYTAGTGGTVSGTSPQTVNHGADGTSVTAVPNAGYSFVNWSDGSTTNPRTDTNVTANISVTANFAINTYTLTYAAGAGGTISGTSPQTVNHGANGTAVTAVPNAGYSFVNWSDGSTANPRTDTNVTANLSVTANFAINTYTLTYAAGAGGTISGTSPQTVNHGANGTAVTAVPNAGYSFVNWSDGSTANPRTDTNVTANISVTANFANATVDLAVSSALITGAIGPSQRITFEVAVDNLTADVDVVGAQFDFSLAPPLSNIAWICVADAGAACPGNGVGLPSHAIHIGRGSGVMYWISADVPAGSTGTTISSLASILVASPYVEGNTANNTATTEHEVGPDTLFRDGFETVPLRVPYPAAGQ